MVYVKKRFATYLSEKLGINDKRIRAFTHPRIRLGVSENRARSFALMADELPRFLERTWSSEPTIAHGTR